MSDAAAMLGLGTSTAESAIPVRARARRASVQVQRIKQPQADVRTVAVQTGLSSKGESSNGSELDNNNYNNNNAFSPDHSEHARSHRSYNTLSASGNGNGNGGYPQYAQSTQRSAHSDAHAAHSRAFDDHLHAQDSSEPKSAFHLILGERHAVEGMWAAVRAQEEMLAQELEDEEEAASERILKLEMDSLKNVQSAWKERAHWLHSTEQQLSTAAFALSKERDELHSRRMDASRAHKAKSLALGQT